MNSYTCHRCGAVVTRRTQHICPDHLRRILVDEVEEQQRTSTLVAVLVIAIGLAALAFGIFGG